MFPNLEDAPEAAHCEVADEDIFQRMQEQSQGDMSWKKMMVFMRKVTSQEFSPSSPSTDVPEGTFSRVFISLVEKMCGAISF